MQDDSSAKQQIVERIKTATNILVTVNSNPSVDELSAVLSLTLMLNKLDKHATAVFSGETPPAINFLEPEALLEHSVDSLRDFIIALDKEKADRLRYKVEDEVVRIFITPYKSVLSQKDLVFSQGDFNVELVIALGVERRDDLDAAITAHGRILHDATVMTINADKGTSDIGTADWSDASASSLCEMLVGLSEALEPGMLDKQTSTALLTGIVASTDRFRNDKTSPRVMTMAAQLMAAGANQQLIAAKLEESETIHLKKPEAVNEDEKPEEQAEEAEKTTKPNNDGSLQIRHSQKPKKQKAKQTEKPKPVKDKASDSALAAAEKELEDSLKGSPADTATDIQAELEKETESLKEPTDDGVEESIEQPAPPTEGATVTTPKLSSVVDEGSSKPAEPETPPVEQSDESASDAALPPAPVTDDSPEAVVSPPVDDDQPRPNWREKVPTTATQPPRYGSAFSSTVDDTPGSPQDTTDVNGVFDAPQNDTSPAPQQNITSTSDSALNFEQTPLDATSGPTLADIDSQARGKSTDEARAAVDAVLDAATFNPAGSPTAAVGASPAVEIQQPAAPVTPQLASPEPVAPPQDTPSSLPPLPDFSTLPPLPGDAQQPVAPQQPQQDPTQQAPAAPPPMPTSAPEAPSPGQFKIPGQQ